MNITWKRLKDLSATVELENQEAIGCYLSKIFHFSEGRSAYWGSWSETYPGDNSFSLNPKKIKQIIEGKRKQGSQFTLSEIPAINIMGETCDIVLFQSRRGYPTEDKQIEFEGYTLVETVKKICELDVSISTFLAPKLSARIAIMPYKTFRSVSQGPYYKLGWRHINSGSRNFGLINNVHSQLTRHLCENR